MSTNVCLAKLFETTFILFEMKPYEWPPASHSALHFPLLNWVHANYTEVHDQYQIVLRCCRLLEMAHSDALLSAAWRHRVDLQDLPYARVQGWPTIFGDITLRLWCCMESNELQITLSLKILNVPEWPPVMRTAQTCAMPVCIIIIKQMSKQCF